jgi:putative hydrolase of the HAD superfamily
MNLKAVFFDLDDTLVVDEAVSREALRATAEHAHARHGANADAFVRDATRQAKTLWQTGPCHAFCRAIGISAFECLWGKFEGDTEDLTRLREWALTYREQVFDAALRDQMIESAEGAHDLAAVFGRERRRLQRLMPDARETLTRLASHYKIALLTNGAPDLQREKIAASGLGSFFSAIAVSGEHGIGKPRAEIFHRLAAEVGVTPDEAIMVGNSLERDIAGAHNAGIASVWIKVPGSEEHHPVEPHHTITGLAELPALLEKHQAG